MVAVGAAAALGGIEFVFCGFDDLRDVNLRCGCSQNITAAGAAQAFNQLGAAQLAEQLFQIGKGDVLPFADGAELNGTILGIHGQIDHCCYGKAAFGGQSHGVVCLFGLLSWAELSNI